MDVRREIKESIYCIFTAFSAQMMVLMLILYVSSPKLYSMQSEVSSLFRLEGGVAKETMLQCLIVAVLAGILRFLFMSEVIIKNMKFGIRLALMMSSVFAVICIAIWQFKWFYATNLASWLGFLCSFGVCMVISVLLSLKSEKMKNDQMNDALRKVQNQQEEKAVTSDDR